MASTLVRWMEGGGHMMRKLQQWAAIVAVLTPFLTAIAGLWIYRQQEPLRQEIAATQQRHASDTAEAATQRALTAQALERLQRDHDGHATVAADQAQDQAELNRDVQVALERLITTSEVLTDEVRELRRTRQGD